MIKRKKLISYNIKPYIFGYIGSQNSKLNENWNLKCSKNESTDYLKKNCL